MKRLLVFLVACVPEPAASPAPAPPQPHIFVSTPPVEQEPQVVFGHVRTPPREEPKREVIVTHDPHECEDERIAVVLSKCTPHLDVRRLYYHCPATMDYNVQRFGEVAMGGLTERCHLPVNTPVQDGPCKIEITRGEIYHDRWGYSHEPAPIERCVQQ